MRSAERIRLVAPRGSDVRHALTYAGAVLAMASAVHLGWVRLWGPAAGVVFVACFLADLAHRQHLARRDAAAAERAARPKD